jgi:hypothetical protein
MRIIALVVSVDEATQNIKIMRNVRNWNFWDWKSIRNIFVFILAGFVVLYFFFNFPDYLRSRTSKLLDQETHGIFIASHNIQRLSQGKSGNKFVIDGMEVDYSYIVNGITYNARDNIPNSLKNHSFLQKLMNSSSRQLRVRYNSLNPQESQIVFNKD